MVSGEKLIEYGLVSTASHPLTVEIIDHGPWIGGNVVTGLITGLLTGGIALAGICLTHWLTQRREKKKSDDNTRRDRYFIATELVFLLEQFAVGCAGVTNEFDYTSGDKSPQVSSPVLDYSAVTGGWRALPPPADVQHPRAGCPAERS
ncbi:hypothetical protein PRCB_09145 [Pantoea rodasii]|uniref:Uncharacterized protein n=1 Tax=Pantoea rodasii TaxID=1076549 RepID=A0A2M9WE56_9GAMM|nr:hypothetical protein [Pantoea rodasii]ORM61168.1 hypothetical protein HA45_20990 [Pantoea rodasii]PJZ05824.1 hypothetical protein PRCB_09145 [Pantoea rodasii]